MFHKLLDLARARQEQFLSEIEQDRLIKEARKARAEHTNTLLAQGWLKVRGLLKKKRRRFKTMISCLWHGWTNFENADACEELLRTQILPGIHRVDGYKGAYLLRREVEDGIEFVIVTLWESMEAVRAFAGEDYEVAVVPPEARRLLARFDRRSLHYETIVLTM
jgi:heme-degrading monooxygenase HmoA